MKLFFIISLFFTLQGFSQENKPNIAVLDFEALAIKKMEAVTLTEKLRGELVKTRKFTVIERGQMDEILKEQEFQMSGCTSQECVVEVGQLLNVQQMMIGSVACH